MEIETSTSMKGRMSRALNYSEWHDAAVDFDKTTGRDSWKSHDSSKYYGYVSIRSRLDQLLKLLNHGQSTNILFELNEGIHGNMDGMGHPQLYRVAHSGTKQLIEDYVDVIVAAIEHLAGDDADEISKADKLDFFRRAQHCYGRSAFMMSGSGTFLYYHIGVVKALWSEELLPSIMSGASGGAMVGAAICTRPNSEITEFFEPEHLMYNRATPSEDGGRFSFLPKRVSSEESKQIIEAEIPDLTFQEAFELTGKHFNVSIAPAERLQTSRLLNAIASPNVYIREAVLASCAVPGLFPAVTLAAKDHNGVRQPYLPNRKWVDGTFASDLPAKRLARLYGTNHSIVSQANPLVSALIDDRPANGSPFRIVRNATQATFKAWANANVAIWQKPMSYIPGLNSISNVGLAILNQNYTGDINIVRPQLLWHPSKLLSRLSLKEITHLIKLGERTAWPKIEMIRTQTKISRTLERVLVDFESELSASQKESVEADI